MKLQIKLHADKFLNNNEQKNNKIMIKIIIMIMQTEKNRILHPDSISESSDLYPGIFLSVGGMVLILDGCSEIGEQSPLFDPFKALD